METNCSSLPHCCLLNECHSYFQTSPVVLPPRRPPTPHCSAGALMPVPLYCTCTGPRHTYVHVYMVPFLCTLTPYCNVTVFWPRSSVEAGTVACVRHLVWKRMRTGKGDSFRASSTAREPAAITCICQRPKGRPRRAPASQ